MLKIVATHKGRREILDREEDRTIADALCAEYQMALGESFVVKVVASQRHETIEGIIDLRAQGLTNAQIAEKLGIKRGTVDAYTSRLGRSGILPRRKAGSREQKTQRNNRIVALYKQGKKTREIADALDMGYFAARTAIYALRKKGRL